MEYLVLALLSVNAVSVFAIDKGKFVRSLTHSLTLAESSATIDVLGLKWLATHHGNPCRLPPHLQSEFSPVSLSKVPA